MGTIAADRPTDAIAALLQERQRYEQWLQALESRRASTAPLVYTRVRQDYEARLSRVLDDIGGRSAELRQVIASLNATVMSLQAEEATKRDLQSEAELRAAVGEYSQEQWSQFSRAGEAEIGRIVARRAEAAAELAQVQQLLNMAGTRRPTAPQPATTEAPGAVVPPPTAAAAAPATAEARVDRPSERAAFDELAFLHSVVEPKPGESRQVGAKPPVADAAPRSSAPPAEAQAPVVPPAPAAPAAPAARPAAPAAAAPAPSPRPAAPGASVPSSRPIAPSLSITLGGPAVPSGDIEQEGEVMEDPEVAAVPSFLRDVPLEQVKTLKCAECGTMNFATEWYCERCGGELAAM